MTRDEYVYSIINSYIVDVDAVRQAVEQVYPIISLWAGNHLIRVDYSGSHAKGTAIRGKADTDLFISLNSTVLSSFTLREIYNNLNTYFSSRNYSTKLQNASIGITHNGFEIDLVPAVKFSGYTNGHWLYVRKTGSERIKTNVQVHINRIANSGRVPEIRAVKVWAMNHNLDFPSIYLELTILDALNGFRIGDISNNFMTVMNYLANRFTNARVVDPANTTNIISNQLTPSEKLAIASRARQSINAATWEDILW